MPKNRVAWRSFWLIATRTHGRMEVLTLDAGGEVVLPIFSFHEEGELFLRHETTEANWWPRETTTGKREILELVSTGRRHFVRQLLGEVTAHSERKNPSGRVTGSSDPAHLRKGQTRPAQPVGRR